MPGQVDVERQLSLGRLFISVYIYFHFKQHKK